MNTKTIVMAGVALVGATVFADAVTSANVVGYMSQAKTANVKYETFGSPFVTPGANGATFRLWDMKIVGSLTAVTKKSNFIQMIDPDTLVLDNSKSYFWDYNKAPSWNPDVKGCWCYKQSDATTGQVANNEVPLDTVFPAGYGFLCIFPTEDKGIGLEFNGQVWQPTPDADGYITVTKPADANKYFFFANPFPVNITLADIKVGGTLTAVTKKSNFIQFMSQTQLELDNVRSYFWDYNKATSADPNVKGCWCYKQSDDTTGQVANNEVLTAKDIVIRPGEGFMCLFPTSGKNISLQVKVPAAIKNL